MTLLVDRRGQKGEGGLRYWLHLTQWLQEYSPRLALNKAASERFSPLTCARRQLRRIGACQDEVSILFRYFFPFLPHFLGWGVISDIECFSLTITTYIQNFL